MVPTRAEETGLQATVVEEEPHRPHSPWVRAGIVPSGAREAVVHLNTQQPA